MKKINKALLLGLIFFVSTITANAQYYDFIPLGDPGFSSGSIDNPSMSSYNGIPYIAYIDAANSSKVTVMKYENNSWQSVGAAGISGGVAAYPSIYVYNGVPYVSFVDYANSSKITVMKYDSGNWQTVGSAGFSSAYLYTNIFVENGIPYVLGNDNVWKYDSGSWQTVGASFGTMALTRSGLFVQNGVPYVGYQNPSTAKLVVEKYESGSWQELGSGFTTSNGTATDISLAVIQDSVFVSYIEYDHLQAPKVLIIHNNVSFFSDLSLPTVSSACSNTSLSIYNNKVYASYEYGGKVRVLRRDLYSDWSELGNAGYKCDATQRQVTFSVSNGEFFVGYKDTDWKATVESIGQRFPKGTGTQTDPFQVSTANELDYVRHNLDLYYLQTADIDLNVAPYNTGLGWIPFPTFSGDYNGAGHTISNMLINYNENSDAGFISDNSGTIYDLGFENVNIGSYYSAGVIAYTNSGIIYQCYTTGSITGYVCGGIVYTHSNGSIGECYSSMTINADSYSGGIAAVSSYNISACYFTGSINKGGGIVGTLTGSGKLTDCYATGAITTGGGLINAYSSGTVSNCFWNTETSGQNSSAGNLGTGKTIAQMKAETTFTDAGWDFTNDWFMSSSFNNGYPTLINSSLDVGNITTTPYILIGSRIGFTAQSGTVSLTSKKILQEPYYLPLNSENVLYYWVVNNLSGGSVKLRLYYEASDVPGFSGAPTIYHYTNGAWEELPTSAAMSSGDLFYVETTGYYSSFSPVTIGDAANPLPVELTSFTAVLTDNGIELKWQTATEVNNYGFEIERSVETFSGTSGEWEKIGFVEGHGNSNSTKEYKFIDFEIEKSNGKIQYRLKQIDSDGSYKYSEIVEVNLLVNLPTKFELSQNYPNPFNPTTKIEFEIPVESRAKLEVYNILGESVEVVFDRVFQPGKYKTNFNGSNLSSGIYFYKLNSDEFSQIRKMVLTK